ncbi:S9 family peptidase [Ammoniphilus sp. CFH 90114]|uniref:alpha/beta hydrolase family protein n=1 Tax=Ammoniphilus sp. CFH 90114 TaxID=2493665 RepID=UPI00100FC221|nr:prolyl oligopeptidase family serine peptidase [Ammoniphilus sp. CFH 90114]RXT02852.1 S9 family peptidase [Ammoniphilus sp. CFH 90114]
MIDQRIVPGFHLQAKLYLISYVSQGLIVKGYLAIPRGNGPFPLLVYCRGGIKNVGMTKLAWVSRFVEQGFIVFAPFYRGNRGGEGREDFGGEDRYDVLETIPWLMEHPLVDAKRMHIFGFSRGSLPALYAAMEYDCFRSVVVWGGVSDMVLTYEERVDLRRMLKRVIGGPPWKKPEEYRYRSPLYRVEELKAPVLIVHGAEDRLVGVEHAHRLSSALHKAGIQYTMRIYEGLGHLFPPEERERAVVSMFSWMEEQKSL